MAGARRGARRRHGGVGLVLEQGLGGDLGLGRGGLERSDRLGRPDPNYRPYPSNNGNAYGNSYGNSYSNNISASSDLEVMLKDFISKQTAFNKSVEEKFGKIDVLASKVDSLALDVEPKAGMHPNISAENLVHSMNRRTSLVSWAIVDGNF